jgi:superfamily II DNA or RNA helicase
VSAREALGDPRAQKARTVIASPFLPGGRPPVPPAESAALVPNPDLPVLRGWQKAAYAEYFRLTKRDFLLVATPGAGKTAYALTIAKELLARREILAVTIVTPTEHLKYQWAQAAKRFGIAIDPSYRNAQGKAGADFQGVAVTYAQVAAHPALHRGRTENRTTLVIFDEVHHAGDALSWGDAVKEAFDPAKRRLALTGTPFRSDANPIPFVTYVPEADGSKRSASDYVYGYGPALSDGVVRPVIFLAYSGEMHWRTRAGDEISATLGTPMTKEQIAQAWRTALDPTGDWIQRVLEAADKRLTEVRRGMPDAGGLVIASDHETARAYAALLRRISGERPAVVLSDDPTASKKISAFGQSTARWMVAVRMVSEGVDVPRLAVGVYATSVSTPLFFAQAVGRFVRARKRGETASVFVPSVPTLLGFAAELEAERDHVVRVLDRDPEAELEAAQRERKTQDDLELMGRSIEVLKASATFDRVLFDGGEFGTATAAGSPEEQDYLGLPGLLEPDQVTTLLRKRQAAQLAARSAATAAAESGPADGGLFALPGEAAKAPEPKAPTVSREQLGALRKELNGLVGAWSHRTGQPHGVIHNELRSSCGGPALPQASAEQIRARIDKIRQWALARRLSGLVPYVRAAGVFVGRPRRFTQSSAARLGCHFRSLTRRDASQNGPQSGHWFKVRTPVCHPRRTDALTPNGVAQPGLRKGVTDER